MMAEDGRSWCLVPDQPPQAALEELRAQVAGLRAASARLREVIEAKDAQLAAARVMSPSARSDPRARRMEAIRL